MPGNADLNFRLTKTHPLDEIAVSSIDENTLLSCLITYASKYEAATMILLKHNEKGSLCQARPVQIRKNNPEKIEIKLARI